eukprot:355528-Chlamydomonas_euryale.AAC.7
MPDVVTTVTEKPSFSCRCQDLARHRHRGGTPEAHTGVAHMHMESAYDAGHARILLERQSACCMFAGVSHGYVTTQNQQECGQCGVPFACACLCVSAFKQRSRDTFLVAGTAQLPLSAPLHRHGRYMMCHALLRSRMICGLLKHDTLRQTGVTSQTAKSQSDKAAMDAWTTRPSVGYCAERPA